MPNVQGILETALYVRDVRVTGAFYRRLFDFPVLLESDRLLALDVAGINVLLLFQQGATSAPYETSGGVIPGHGGIGGGHFAFTIATADWNTWLSHLEEAGVPVESVVRWDENSRSLYFRDPDQNLVELMTPGFWKLRGVPF